MRLDCILIYIHILLCVDFVIYTYTLPKAVPPQKHDNKSHKADFTPLKALFFTSQCQLHRYFSPIKEAR